MNDLKNWDNKTWLSSEKYIFYFCKFLKSKNKISKKTTILDIGCGRAHIISKLQNKYKFTKKPVGIDIIKNTNIKKNIIFKKTDAIKYLSISKERFDIILIKQTIHFLSNKNIKILLTLAKNKLRKDGRLFIFSLKTNGNEIPGFKQMNKILKRSLKKDKVIFKEIKNNLKNINISYFNYKVIMPVDNYVFMLKNRYISCLLKMSKKILTKGIQEFKSMYKKKIIFTDKLICIIYKN
jgi:SAM-dependent methyltransferase